MIVLTDFENEFKKFNELRNEYRRLMEENTTVSQRSFSFRIDANYSLLNSLKDWIKNEDKDKQKECYKIYLLLIDVWFSYEALLHLANDEGFSNKYGSKPEKLLKSRIQNELVSDIVDHFYNDLKPIVTKDQRKKSLIKYITTLINYPGTSTAQRKQLNDFKIEIETEKFDNPNYYRVLAFVYAIRNGYVHNGETAFSGTEHYIVKLMILSIAYNFMFKFILRSGSRIFDYMIETIS